MISRVPALETEHESHVVGNVASTMLYMYDSLADLSNVRFASLRLAELAAGFRNPDHPQGRGRSDKLLLLSLICSITVSTSKQLSVYYGTSIAPTHSRTHLRRGQGETREDLRQRALCTGTRAGLERRSAYPSAAGDPGQDNCSLWMATAFECDPFQANTESQMDDDPFGRSRCKFICIYRGFKKADGV